MIVNYIKKRKSMREAIRKRINSESQILSGSDVVGI